VKIRPRNPYFVRNPQLDRSADPTTRQPTHLTGRDPRPAARLGKSARYEAVWSDILPGPVLLDLDDGAFLACLLQEVVSKLRDAVAELGMESPEVQAFVRFPWVRNI